MVDNGRALAAARRRNSWRDARARRLSRSTSSLPKLIFPGLAALAEFERNLIRERTQAGLEAARARGRKGGRPKALNGDKRMLAVRLYEEKEHSVGHICKLMSISRPALYEHIEEARKISCQKNLSCFR